MWRKRNLHEDWEQRKTYLIRSLFQDIPLLSPLPENYESRQTFTSVSPLPQPTPDVSSSRPESPLPRLIIEKMPNRHDEPPEFYRDLEKKIKNIYRKIFFSEEVGSEEDVPESYIDAMEFSLDVVGTDKNYISPGETAFCPHTEHDRDDNITVCQGENNTSHRTPKSPSNDDSDLTDMDLVFVAQSGNMTAQEENNTSHRISQQQNTTNSPLNDDSDINDNDLRYEEDLAAVFEAQSDDTSSSNVNGDIETQITAEAVVHQTDDFKHVQLNIEDLNKCSSPILELKSRSVFIQGQIREPLQDTEKFSSRSNSDSEMGDEEVSQGESCDSDDTSVSVRSVELMRRQEIISPSLGSVQDDLDETEKSKQSDVIGFKRKTSFEIHPEETAWMYNAAEEFRLSGEEAHDFHNVSTVMSPIPLSNFNRSSTDFENLCGIDRINCDIPAYKRKKYEHLSVQTSVEDNENTNWISMKSNFFVGAPTILKLCSCYDHKCEKR